MKILIVEDNAVSAAVLEAALVKLGHQPTRAADGILGWDAFQCDPVRVVVSDWLMPGMDGLDLCKRIRAHGAEYVYFILLTGKMLGADHYAKAMDEGVDDFLTKPLDVDALRTRLRVAERIVQLTERVRTLEGILPMCAYCRRIRDEHGAYASLEDFVSDKTPAQFSHGVCPDCAKKHFPD